MEKQHDYIDRVLIKLKRQYSKDELVSALLKELKEKDIEIGKLNAEIEHLNSELQSDKEQKEIKRQSKIEARKQEMYAYKVNECNKQRAEIKKLRQDKNNLISKYIILEQKYEQLK